jgi:prepilin-type N-terminal cleavage/methylation domain-containing protein
LKAPQIIFYLSSTLRTVKSDLLIRRNPAFTLVELVVVLAIIAILMSLLPGGIKSVQDARRRVEAKSTSFHIVFALNAYHTGNGHFPPIAGPAGRPTSQSTQDIVVGEPVTGAEDPNHTVFSPSETFRADPTPILRPVRRKRPISDSELRKWMHLEEHAADFSTALVRATLPRP